MDERQLDDLLKNGKREAGEFFSHINSDSIRKVVLRGISENSSSEPEKRRTRYSQFRPRALALKAGTVSVCLIIVLLLLFGLNGSKPGLKENNILAQQAVSLDSSDRDYIISFMPLNMPNNNERSLMALLWEMDGVSGPEIVYSSLFEQCDEPYPVSTIVFPGTNGKVVLISSGDSRRRYMHYRLIGHSNDSVTTLWAQDYVPEGKLGINNGVLEQSNQDNTLVSYIVPYKTNNAGEFFLPVESIKVRVGEQILLVGDDTSGQLKVSSEKGMIRKIDNSDLIYDSGHNLAFQAFNKGEDTLSFISGENRSYQKLLSVLIMD